MKPVLDTSPTPRPRVTRTSLCLCALTALSLLSCHRPNPLPGFPQIILWAWERPEDLSFINPKNAGVAFLARTVTLENNRMRSVPRLQPLRVPPSTALIAVIRIESRNSPLPDEHSVAQEIIRTSKLPGVRALQIDFDARASERPWYTSLLRHLHTTLKMPLTITALASWCQSDAWIRTLPVADAVPMLFRMGSGEQWNGADFSIPLCRSSLGLSTDELPATVPRARRIYFFHPKRWTPEAYQGIIGEARRRQ